MKTEEMKYGPGEYATVDGCALEQMTKAGWQIVHTYQVQRVETVHEKIPMLMGQPGINQYNYDAQATRGVVLDVTKFLLRKVPDQVIDELRKRNESLKTDMRAACDRYLEAEKKITALNEELSKARADESFRKESRETLARNLEAASASKRKLEEDMGKLREAIGSVKFNEIVAPKVAT